MSLGCGPGTTLWNPDRPYFGAETDPLPLDPECKNCGCAGGCGCGADGSGGMAGQGSSAAGGCGCDGGCGGGRRESTGLPGLDRAIQLAEVLPNAIPKIRGTHGTFPLGSWQLEPATGNLIAQVRTPVASVYDPRPVLTYNMQSTTETEFGYGWTEMHRQRVTQVNINTVDITKGTGAVLRYSQQGGIWTPPDGA